MIITNNSRTLLSSQINASKNNQYMSVSDIVSEKQKKMHDELYNRALNRFKQQYPQYTSGNNNTDGKLVRTVVFTERLSEEGYNKPSHVIMTEYDSNNKMEGDKTPPIVRYEIDLSPWWDDDIMDEKEISNKKQSKFKEWTDWSNCECVYKDYINNTARIYNRIEHWYKEISLSMLNSINSSGKYYIPDSEQQNIVKSGTLFTTMWKELHPEKYNG